MCIMWLKAVMEKRVSEEVEEAAMAENTRSDEEEERRRPKKVRVARGERRLFWLIPYEKYYV